MLDSVTNTLDPNTPTAPQSLSGTAADGQVSLSWSAPDSIGSSLITSYFLEDKASASPTWQTYATTSSSTLSSVVSGLSDGVSYDFRVSAINSSGTSVPSSIFTATPTAPSGGGGGGGYLLW